MEKLKIVICDDEEIIRNEISEYLKKNSYSVFEVSNGKILFPLLKKEEIDIILLDIKLPEINGLDILKKVKKIYPDIVVIMITGHGDQDTVLKALKYGAFDFFNKPINTIDIDSSIKRTQKYIELNKKYKQIENNLKNVSKNLYNDLGQIIGNSKEINSVLNLCYKASESRDTSVLIMGESGTGKELIAREIHKNSEKINDFFYTLNCSAIPESLIESELFGHIKGAFTGAIENKMGCFEAANGGTIFLDEIGDMPIVMQSKLLRVIEEKKIKRIGSNNEINIDVKIISATNKNLQNLIENKKFRLDLYYRLNIFEIILPPLRKRKEDIDLLLNHYLDFYSKKMQKNIKNYSQDAIEILTKYDYPGNIRELKNIIQRAVILCESSEIQIKDISIKKNGNNVKSENTNKNCNFNMEQNEKNIILKALHQTEYNISKAAKLVGLTRQSLFRKMKKYKLN